jgi:hypothetical protein
MEISRELEIRNRKVSIKVFLMKKRTLRLPESPQFRRIQLSAVLDGISTGQNAHISHPETRVKYSQKINRSQMDELESVDNRN